MRRILIPILSVLFLLTGCSCNKEPDIDSKFLESTAVGDGRKTSSTRCPYEAMHQSAIIRTKQARDKSFNCILFTIFLLFFCAAADAVFCFVIVLSIGIVNYDTLTQRSVTTMQ